MQVLKVGGDVFPGLCELGLWQLPFGNIEVYLVFGWAIRGEGYCSNPVWM